MPPPWEGRRAGGCWMKSRLTFPSCCGTRAPIVCGQTPKPSKRWGSPNLPRIPTKGSSSAMDRAEPTGILREGATELAESHVPKHTPQEAQRALAWSLNVMLSFGITSFTEAAVGFSTGVSNELAAYAALADTGALKQRVRLCMV